MANRLKVRNTRPANREVSGRGLPIEKTPLPQFTIGRSMVSRRELRDPKDNTNNNAMLSFLAEIKNNKSNVVLGRVASVNELFINYVDNTELNKMLEVYLQDSKGARRREKRSLRAVANMRQVFLDAQRQDGVLSNIDLEARTYAHSFFEGDEELYLPVVDPGPFDKWGVIGVSCSKQPLLLDDYTIGVGVEVTDSLRDDYRRVASLLSNCGLDTSILDDKKWEPRIPVFRTFGKIPLQSTIENITIPSPPGYAAAQPVAFRSYKG